MDQARVRRLLTQYFSESELRTLCFDLGVDYDGLPGDSKEDKARELVGYFWRRGSGMALLETIRDLRPNAPWNGSLKRVLREGIFETQELRATQILRKMGETGGLGVDYRTLLELSNRINAIERRTLVTITLSLVSLVMTLLAVALQLMR